MSGLLWLFDRTEITKLFFWELLAALLLLGDGRLLILFAQKYGAYAALAMAGGTGLLALFVIKNSIDSTLEVLRRNVRAGIFPETEYCNTIGLVISGTLLLVPGLFTDLLGVIVFIVPFRTATGRFIARRLSRQLKETYEYLKLREFS